jgi:diadenosine tetraphosphate (Ap4A) HIT family hydrolase
VNLEQFDLNELRSGELVLENELCLYSSHRFDENVGVLPYSGIIVPKRIAETVFDLHSDEILATFALLEHVKTHLDATIRPDGYTIGWNCYPVASQVIPHAHLHVIPRFADEPKAGQGIRYHLKQADNRRPNPRAPGSGLARKERE